MSVSPIFHYPLFHPNSIVSKSESESITEINLKNVYYYFVTLYFNYKLQDKYLKMNTIITQIKMFYKTFDV